MHNCTPGRLVVATLLALTGVAGCGGDDDCNRTIGLVVTSADRLYVEAGTASAEYLLRFNLPVPTLNAEAIVLAQTRGTGADTTFEVTPGDEPGTHRITLHPGDWAPGDAFALTLPATLGDACGRTLGADFQVTVAPYPAAGTGEDVRALRPLQTSSYTLPDEFYDALSTLGIDPTELHYPDAGSTFDNTPTRLHWTDTVRHQGDTLPTFTYMIVDDVDAALADPRPDQVLRRLLVAQHTYNERDGFVTSGYDPRVALTAVEQPLLDALRVFYEHPANSEHPDPPTEPWASYSLGLEAYLAVFPHDVQVALALAIRGLIVAADLRDEALLSRGELTMDQWAGLHAYFWSDATYSTYRHEYGTTAHPGVDFELLARAGQVAVRAVETLRVALADQPPVPGATLELVGPLGRIAVSLEDADDTWQSDDFFLLVDLAGNDTYLDQVATNTGIHYPVSVLLDLAGDDVYRPTVDWTIQDGYVALDAAHLQGAGVFGVAVLDDAAGNDEYHGSAVCQGAGIFGVGVLVDHGGVDSYRGYVLAQGSADFGFGLLLDRGPEGDAYETYQKSQGYGGPRGIGWLVDEAGDDTYLAIAEPIVADWAGEGTNWSGSMGFGFGVRDGYFTPGAPVFSGGLGALLDLDGNDRYQCAVMCLGFGYAFGAGIFYDRAGDDDYLITHKYALGGATHWAIGAFVDGQGADHYRNAGDDECIGIGYDASVAFHIDRGDEDDVYVIDNVGDFAVGVSRIPALGVLINEGGNDTYTIPGSGTRALGRSWTGDGNRDGYLAEVLNVALFLDLAGPADVYDLARAECVNGSTWIQVDPDGPAWTPTYDFGYGYDGE